MKAFKRFMAFVMGAALIAYNASMTSVPSVDAAGVDANYARFLQYSLYFYDAKDLAELQSFILNRSISFDTAKAVDVFDLVSARETVKPPERTGVLRTVNVATPEQLTQALADAKAGDEIVLKSGTYLKTTGGSKGSRFHGNVSGTAENPIYLRSENLDEPAVLDGGEANVGSGYTLYISGEYWVVEDLEIKNAQKGIVLDKASRSIIRGCYIHHTGEEALAIRDNSSYCLVENTKITDTGQTGIYSEGIYVGSSYSNQGTYGAKCDYNTVRNCIFGPNIRAKAYTAKEGTTGNVVEYCTFYGAGMKNENSCRSFLELQGNGAIIRYNTFYRQGNEYITTAFKVYAQVADWGYNNDLYDNMCYLDDPSVYLIEIVSNQGSARISGNKTDPPECANRYRPSNTTGVTEY